jgi:hypothetical protein
MAHVLVRDFTTTKSTFFGTGLKSKNLSFCGGKNHAYSEIGKTLEGDI